MPKTNTSKHHNTRSGRVPVFRRPWFIIGLTIIIVIIVVIMLAIQKQPTPVPTDSSDTPAQVTPVSAPETAPSQEPEPADDPKEIIKYEGGDPNRSDTLSGQITYQGVEDGTLTVVANIDQYLSGGGNCTLHLFFGSREVRTVSSPIVADVSTSVCGPVEVPVHNLKSGEYSIKLDLKTSTRTGQISSQITL